MTVYKEFNIGGGKGGSPFGMFGPILALTLFFVMLFFLAKGVFWILSWVAPVLLLATAIIDYKTITDYIQFLFKLLKDNPLLGLVGIVLTIVGFPVVSGFLFFKALARRAIKKRMGPAKEKEEYADYEEVEDEVEDFLELPEVEKIQSQKGRQGDTNEYEDLFD